MDYLQGGGAPQSTQANPNGRRSAEAYNPPDGFRAIAQGTAPQRGSGVPPALAAEVAFLMKRMVKLLENTNFTAAEPAYNAPHYWSQPIDLSARVTVPAAAGAYAVALTVPMPEGRGVRITGYGFNVLDPLYTYDGSILFQVCKNGSAVPGLQDIAEQRGTLVLPASTFILAESWREDRITFMVRRAVAAVGSTDVDVCLKGYSWRPLNQAGGPKIGVAF
jgi:hypothetical protein